MPTSRLIIAIVSILIGTVIYAWPRLSEYTGDKTKKDKTEEKTKSKTKEKLKILLFSFFSVVAAFSIGGLADHYIGAEFAGYFLPSLVGYALTFLTVAFILAICGVAISFVTPATNKNLSFAIIMVSFLFVAHSAAIQHYRRDYFNTKTGDVKVWTTESSRNVWWDKPSFKYDPETGKKIRLATRAEVEKIQERRREAAAAKKTTAQPRPRVDYKIYRPGDVFYFKGKTGEYSPYWIRPVIGTQSNFQSKYGKYGIVTRSGKRWPVKKIPNVLHEDYKIFTVTKCDMRIVFKPIN